MEQRRTKSVIHNPCKLFLQREVSNAVNHVFNTQQGDTKTGAWTVAPQLWMCAFTFLCAWRVYIYPAGVGLGLVVNFRLFLLTRHIIFCASHVVPSSPGLSE